MSPDFICWSSSLNICSRLWYKTRRLAIISSCLACLALSSAFYFSNYNAFSIKIAIYSYFRLRDVTADSLFFCRICSFRNSSELLDSSLSDCFWLALIIRLLWLLIGKISSIITGLSFSQLFYSSTICLSLLYESYTVGGNLISGSSSSKSGGSGSGL